MDEHNKLLAEAHSLGLHYTGTDTLELRALLDMARAQRGREHPVPCFGLSFDPTDRRCRICSLRNPCADADRKPRIEVTTAKLSPVPCEICREGRLEVELLDLETRELRDFGCSTPGCPGTVAVQYGWETHGAAVVRDIEFKPVEDPEMKKPVKLRVVKPGEVAPPATEAPRAKVVLTDKVPALATRLPAAEKAAPVSLKRVRVAAPKAVAPEPEPVPEPAAAEAPRRRGKARKPSEFRIKSGTPDLVGFKASTLTAIVCKIVGGRSWSARKFFGNEALNPKPGTTLFKLYRGTTYYVEVM